jgi:hypothetical protein
VSRKNIDLFYGIKFLSKEFIRIFGRWARRFGVMGNQALLDEFPVPSRYVLASSWKGSFHPR